MRPGRTGAGVGAVPGAGDGMPRIGRQFLEEERTTLGERWFRQEYLCDFEDSVSGVFDRDLVHRAITDKVKPLKIDWD